MAKESVHRQKSYLMGECNAFDAKRPVSRPMFFWNDDDVWKYLRDFDVPYSPIYDMGYDRTGCTDCMYGLHMEEPGNTRFDRMKKTHPKRYDYVMNKLGLKAVIEFWLKRKIDD